MFYFAKVTFESNRLLKVDHSHRKGSFRTLSFEHDVRKGNFPVWTEPDGG